MKIAIVADDLIQFGGQERLILVLTEIWPNAHVYTSVMSKKMKDMFLKRNLKVTTSYFQKLPLIEKLNRFYSPFLIHILGIESFDFRGYDIVLSVSSRYSHHSITNARTHHVCYMNTPGRMFWETHEYFEKESLSQNLFTKRILHSLLKLPLMYIRLLDFAASQRVNSFISNSSTPKKRLEKYYKRKSIVIYPPVDVKKCLEFVSSEGDYFVIITRLSSWKRVDIAIEACIKLNLKLYIIGEGSAAKQLKQMANTNIHFFDYVDDDTKYDILSKCRALIQTQKEDFGIACVEALACGKPVIGYGEGGILEIIKDQETGVLFFEQTAESLINALKSFETLKFDSSVCRGSVRGFDKEVFKEKIYEYIKNISML